MSANSDQEINNGEDWRLFTSPGPDTSTMGSSQETPSPEKVIKRTTHPLVSPPNMNPPKQPTNPLISPPLMGGKKRSKAPRRRTSLNIVWPPPKPNSFSHSSHSRSSRDISVQSYHSAASPGATPGSTSSGQVQRGSILSNVPAPGCLESQDSDPALVSPAEARAKLVIISPGNVKTKLKSFSHGSPPSWACKGKISPPDSSSQRSVSGGSVSRRPSSPLKKSPSKRLKNRWPPVTTKKKDTNRDLKTIKKEIRSNQVRSAKKSFERRSLAQINSLPFLDEDSFRGNLPLDAQSDHFKSSLSRFEGGSSRGLSESEHVIRSPLSDRESKSMASGLGGSEHVRSTRSLFERSHSTSDLDSNSAYKPSKRSSFRKPLGSASEHGMGSIHEDNESAATDRLPEIVLPNGQKLPKPQQKKQLRRTNYKIRYEGPTLLRLFDVYGELANIPEADERFQKEDGTDSMLTSPSRRSSAGTPQSLARKRLSQSENDSLPHHPPRRGSAGKRPSKSENDSLPNHPPRRESDTDVDGYDEFYDDEEAAEDEASLDEVLLVGGKRPDVWITPVQPQGTWKVKRVWDQEEADEKEQEHVVDGVDLMGSIRDLLGVPDGSGDDILSFEETSDKDSKSFFMKCVYDVGGEIEGDEEERTFNLMSFEKELNTIVQEASHSDVEDDDDRRMQMVYGEGQDDYDSDDERQFQRMANAPNAENPQQVGGDEPSRWQKMSYGDGDDDDDSDDEGRFKKMEQEKERRRQANMTYGNGDGPYDSDDDQEFRRMPDAPKEDQSEPNKSNMVFGEGDGGDSDDEDHCYQKMQQGDPAPSKTRMVFGDGDDDESDDEREFMRSIANSLGRQSVTDGDMGSSADFIPEERLNNSAGDIDASPKMLDVDELRKRRSGSDNDIPKISWPVKAGLASANKQHFKKSSWVIQYGASCPPIGGLMEDATEPSSTSTSEADETEKRDRILPWQKKGISPKREKKDVKLWFMA